MANRELREELLDGKMKNYPLKTCENIVWYRGSLIYKPDNGFFF